MPTTINCGVAAKRICGALCCQWWAPSGVPGANPARPALPQLRREHKERPELGMTDACHRARVLHHLNPPGRTKHRTQAAPEGAPGYAALCPIPGGEGPKTAHQAAPEGTPGNAALCPGPSRRQETRDSCGPHAGSAASACQGRRDEVGNVPTPRSATPHGVRDPGLTPHGVRAHGAKTNDYQMKRSTRRTRA